MLDTSNCYRKLEEEDRLMSNRYFPIQNSTSSSEALSQFVSTRYALGSPLECYFFHRGVNDTYVIPTQSDTFYLRVYRAGWRTQDEIASEVKLLNYLSENQIPVATPVPMKDGSYIHEINALEGIRFVVLFTNAPGKPHIPLSKKQCYRYGRVAGRIHRCADEIGETYTRFHLDLAHLIDTPLGHIEPFLTHRRGDFDFLVEVSNGLKAQVESCLTRRRPEYGICHGDLNRANVHFDASDNVTLFDFDCFGYGWRAYDIAVFLWSHGWNKEWPPSKKSQRTQRWNSFLSGYTRERNLGNNELKAVQTFVVIRYIWIMGLHTGGAKVWGRGWINDEYFDTIIEHIKNQIRDFKIL